MVFICDKLFATMYLMGVLVVCIGTLVVIAFLLKVKSRITYFCARKNKTFTKSLKHEFTTFNWGKKHATYCPYCKEVHWVTSHWK